LILWYTDTYETLFNRLTSARPLCARCWHASRGRGPHLPDQLGQPQALATPAPYTGRFDPTASIWSYAHHRARPVRPVASPTGCRTRCLACRPGYPLECRPWHDPEHLDDRAGHPPLRLVAKDQTLIASERDPWARALFALQQATLDATDLVVLSEFGSNLDMHPTHAWAPIGERAVAAVPRNTPLNTTTIAALTAQGMGPALMVAGGVDQRIFATYLEQVLAPTLRVGQVVLADNLSAHKSERAQEIIAGCGCTLVYLPPYSPDYSPIELAIAKIKTELRRATARTREALEAAIAAALAQITAADARAFFLHCGYRFLPDLDQWFCS
jgi:transposase